MVIALIAILAALLFPVLGRSRRSAHDMMCKSNLRQMGIALAAYTADFRAFPSYVNPFWHYLLEPYSGATWSPNLFRGRADARSRFYLCPGYARLSPLWDPVPVGWPYPGWEQMSAYAYNARGVTDGRVRLGLGDDGGAELRSAMRRC